MLRRSPKREAGPVEPNGRGTFTSNLQSSDSDDDMMLVTSAILFALSLKRARHPLMMLIRDSARWEQP